MNKENTITETCCRKCGCIHVGECKIKLSSQPSPLPESVEAAAIRIIQKERGQPFHSEIECFKLGYQYHQAHHSEEVETKYNTLIEGLNDEINAYEVEVEKLTRELTDEAYNGQQLLEQRNKLRDLLSKVLNFTASMDEWDEIENQIRKEIGI